MARRSRRRRRSRDDWGGVASAYREMRKRRRRSKLQRDPNNGYLGGVCAGIANYLGLEAWMIRLIVIAFVLFGALLLILVIYGILWIVLDPMEDEDSDQLDMDDVELEMKSETIRTSPKLGLRVAREDVRELDLRLRRLETYVTSTEYEFDKNFKEMG